MKELQKKDIVEVVGPVKLGKSIYLLIPLALADKYGYNDSTKFLLYVDAEGRLIYEPQNVNGGQ